MKTQIKKELHIKSIPELRAQLKEAKEEKRVLNLDHEMGKLKNTSAINQKRVEIAVISTIINEKTAEEKIEKIVKADSKKEATEKEKSVSAKTKEDKKAGLKSQDKGGIK